MSPIGVFDSGYGGLTILRSLIEQMPAYDFIYLGDNARTPYGNRSFETVYEYTLQSVQSLFKKGCNLVILACNTASAKALRQIQQKDLPSLGGKKVLGVIRPTIEAVGNWTKTNSVGVLGTIGTVKSGAYVLELAKQFPEIRVSQEACPMWVPIVENGEIETEGADFFINKNLQNLLKKDKNIDTIILGCTHYPLLIQKIGKFLPKKIRLLEQGDLVVKSLISYLARHPEIDSICSKNANLCFYTTDSTEIFDMQASLFFGQSVRSEGIDL